MEGEAFSEHSSADLFEVLLVYAESDSRNNYLLFMIHKGPIKGVLIIQMSIHC